MGDARGRGGYDGGRERDYYHHDTRDRDSYDGGRKHRHHYDDVRLHSNPILQRESFVVAAPTSLD